MLAIGDKVVVEWTWGGSRFEAAGVVTKVSGKTVKVRLTEHAGEHFAPGFIVTAQAQNVRKDSNMQTKEWHGSDYNERAYNSVHNGLVNIIIDGPTERSPAIIEKAKRVLADLNRQTPPKRGQISHDARINQLRRMIHAAEEVMSGHRAPTGDPKRGPALRASSGDWGIWDATRQKWLPDAMRGAVDSSPAHYKSQADAERAADEWRNLNPDDEFEVLRHDGSVRELCAPGHHAAAHREPADEQAATELVLFIENESDLSPDGPKGQGRSVLVNALRKWRKGTYDPALGVKLFEYLAEAGAKRYAKEFSVGTDWSAIFNPATRHEAARQLEASFSNSAKNGEYDRVDIKEGVVKDYEAIDRRDRVIAGPFKSYGDAKSAAGSAGAVRFVPSKGKRASEPRDPVIKVGDTVRAIDDGDTGRVLQIQVPGEDVPDGVPEYAGHDGQVWYWVGWSGGTRTWIGENDIKLVRRGTVRATEAREPSRSAHHPTTRRR